MKSMQRIYTVVLFAAVFLMAQSGIPYSYKLVTVKGIFAYADFYKTTYGFVSSPTHGNMFAVGRPTYVPDAGYTGPDSFYWKISDTAGISTCRILVRDTNSRANMVVLLVVRDTLLPQINSEILRLQADLQNEG